MNRTWTLQFARADELGQWHDVGKYPTGDSAKTNARHHQSGQGEIFDYQILSPNGLLWARGRARHNKRGMRMVWSA